MLPKQASAGKNARDLRGANRVLLLSLIREAGSISRAELARRTRLTRSTVSQVVADLIERNLVREEGPVKGGPGRRPVSLRYQAESQLVLGLDIGGTNIVAALGDLDGNILRHETWPLPAFSAAAPLLDWLADRSQTFVSSYAAGRHPCVAGVATPGVVDVQAGVVLDASPNLPEWNGLALSAELERRMGWPVLVENDVNLALLGEMRAGAAVGKENVALLVVSTGIGGALALGGRLYRGRRGAAGELGYWLMGREHLASDWGTHGCLESLVSGSAIARRAVAECLDLGHPTAKELFASARGGHAQASRVVAEVADWLGMAVTNLLSLLDLDCVLLGGGVAQSADLLLDRIQATVARHSLGHPLAKSVIQSLVQTTALRELSGVRGALQIAADRAVERSLQDPEEALLR